MGSGCYFGVAPGGGRERRGCPGSRRGGGGGGGKAAAICGAAPARADPVAEVPPVRRGSRPSCSQRGVTLGVRVGDDGKRRYRPGEALPGVPRCGCRRTPLSASGGGAYPGDAGHPNGPWAARAPRRTRSRGRESCGGDLTRSERGGCVGRRRRMGRPRRGASSPRALAGTAPYRSRGKRCWREEGGKKKKPTGRTVYEKQIHRTPFLAYFDFTSVSRSRRRTPPSRRCLGSGAAARSPLPPSLPGPRSGEAGRSPSLPGGTGPSWLFTFPCPLRRRGRWGKAASSPARPPGARDADDGGPGGGAGREARTAAR